MKNLAHVAAALILVLTTAEAQTVAIIGAGNSSCGRWTAEHMHEGAVSADENAWIIGFLSGAAYDSGGTLDPLKGVDAQAVWAWISNYCAAHPLDRIAEAGAAFIAAHPAEIQLR